MGRRDQSGRNLSGRGSRRQDDYDEYDDYYEDEPEDQGSQGGFRSRLPSFGGGQSQSSQQGGSGGGRRGLPGLGGLGGGRGSQQGDSDQEGGGFLGSVRSRLPGGGKSPGKPGGSSQSGGQSRPGLPGSRTGGSSQPGGQSRPGGLPGSGRSPGRSPGRSGNLPGSQTGGQSRTGGLPGGSRSPGRTGNLPGSQTGGQSRPGGLPGSGRSPGRSPGRTGTQTGGQSRPGGLPGSGRSPGRSPGRTGNLPGSQTGGQSRPGGLPGSGSRSPGRSGSAPTSSAGGQSRPGGLPGSGRSPGRSPGRSGTSSAGGQSRPGGLPSSGRSPGKSGGSSRPGGLPSSGRSPGKSGGSSRPGGLPSSGRSPSKTSGGRSPGRSGGGRPSTPPTSPPRPGSQSSSRPGGISSRPGGSPGRSPSRGGSGRSPSKGSGGGRSPTRKPRSTAATTKARGKQKGQEPEPLMSLDTKLDIIGIGLIIFALITILSFFSQSPGALTRVWLRVIYQLFGWGAFVVPIVVGAVGVWLIWRHFGDQLPPVDPVRIIGLSILSLGALTLMHAAVVALEPVGDVVYINPADADPSMPGYTPTLVWENKSACPPNPQTLIDQGWVLQRGLTLTSSDIAKCGYGGGWIGYFFQSTLANLLGAASVFLIAIVAVIGGGMMTAKKSLKDMLELARNGVGWIQDKRSATAQPAAATRAAGGTASSPGKPADKSGRRASLPGKGKDDEEDEEADDKSGKSSSLPGRPSIVTGRGPGGTPGKPGTSPASKPADDEDEAKKPSGAPGVGKPSTPGSRPATGSGSPAKPGAAATAGSKPGSGSSPGRPGLPSSGSRPGQPPGSSGKPGTPKPGSSGSTGAPGASRPTGAPGSSGRPGLPGRPGSAGAPGSTGAPGTSGSPGQPGASRPAGTSGSPGQPGASRPAGTSGSPGQPGASRPAGTSGSPGQPGASRPTGTSGPSGQPGASGPSGLPGRSSGGRPGGPTPASRPGLPGQGSPAKPSDDEEEDDSKPPTPSEGKTSGVPFPKGNDAPAAGPDAPRAPTPKEATQSTEPVEDKDNKKAQTNNGLSVKPLASAAGAAGVAGVVKSSLPTRPSGPGGSAAAAARPASTPAPKPTPKPTEKPGGKSGRTFGGDFPDFSDLGSGDLDDLDGLDDLDDLDLDEPGFMKKSTNLDSILPPPPVKKPEAAKPSEAKPEIKAPAAAPTLKPEKPQSIADKPTQTATPDKPEVAKPEVAKVEPPKASAAPTSTGAAAAPSARVTTPPTREVSKPAVAAAAAAQAAKPEVKPETKSEAKPGQPPKIAQAAPAKKPDWLLPDVEDVLEVSVRKTISDEELRRRAAIIEQTLSSFGAPGRVVELNHGPVVTQFGVEPDYIDGRAGKRIKVKVGKISALSDDIALALAAPAIRIEAPVPGKGYVGIEVPNSEASIVGLRDALDTPEFRNLDSPLKLALGHDVSGSAIAADMTSLPHLLIAGTTGSGKSVCVNGIISTMLMTCTPDELQMIMVDPKRVELTNYNGIPHLLSPVVTELERIVGVLKWVQREMDDRYRKFAMAGARNITDFNTRVDRGQVPNEKRLPFILVIVDELADLMMLAPDETERVITRLAQMARATGIHIILSTQRPSVDVVTGLIKANFPARIAFAVATGVDSRVILDMPGAEKLLGRGDMLFQAPDAPLPIRMQGVYVSDKEIQKLVDYWRRQAAERGHTPKVQTLDAKSSTSSGSLGSLRVSSGDMASEQRALFGSGNGGSRGEKDEADDLFNEAVELVRSMEKASISLLQRHLRIGYTRAARLIDLMEERGVIGPHEGGSKPREVLDADGNPLSNGGKDDD